MMAPARICPEARKLAKPDAGTSGEPADDGLWVNSPGPLGCRARGARGVGEPCRWPGIAFGPPPGGSPPRASNATAIPVRNSGWLLAGRGGPLAGGEEDQQKEKDRGPDCGQQQEPIRAAEQGERDHEI